MSPSVFVACGLVTGIAGHVIWSEYKRPPPAPAVAGSVAAAPLVCKPDPQELRSQVRRAVREAVRGDAPNPLAEALRTGTLMAPTPGEETEDNRQARGETRALLDAAIHAGLWTDDDVTKFRVILPRLSATDRPGALTEVSRAIDEHRFKVEATVPF